MARLQLLEQLQQESYRKSTQCIHDNEEEIRRLKAALQNKEDDLWKSQTCRKELEQQIEILTTANKQVKLEQNRRQLAEELLQKAAGGRTPFQFRHLPSFQAAT